MFGGGSFGGSYFGGQLSFAAAAPVTAAESTGWFPEMDQPDTFLEQLAAEEAKRLAAINAEDEELLAIIPLWLSLLK
jgi:hypothetical protein